MNCNGEGIINLDIGMAYDSQNKMLLLLYYDKNVFICETVTWLNAKTDLFSILGTKLPVSCDE